MDIQLQQITIHLTEGELLIFLQSGVEELLGLLGIEPTTLDFSSQSSSSVHTLMLRADGRVLYILIS